jgi:ketosteroid isomerase-like protein
MSENADRLREVFAARDFDAFVSLFAQDAQWVWWEPDPVCRDKAQIVARLNEVRAEGTEVDPEIVYDGGDRLVVRPRTKPLFEVAPDLHHVYTFEAGQIVHLEDFPDRDSALAAVQS